MIEALIEPLDAIARLSPRLALREAGPLLAGTAGQSELRRAIQRAIANAPRTAAQPTFETLARADGWSLELFVWARGATTPIHDHTSWGIYVCLAGTIGEQRYARLDDESASGVARLRRDWQALWRPGEQSELLPYAGGIHRVKNAGLTPAVSLHLYGPPGQLDGRDYDPRRDFVCDRPLLAA
ncbi:MAG TPA: cysteine dioxygenase family protein [Chloroflexota bacterium]|nr:cysteine dioxygenase family protein [Chloroflexota bacterium]